jgi:hypothetical protein
MRVVREVRGDGDDVEAVVEVFRPVIDEDGMSRPEGQVHRQVVALGVTALLGEVAVDEVVHLKLLGAGPGVGIPAGAPEEHLGAAGQRVEELPCPRPQ